MRLSHLSICAFVMLLALQVDAESLSVSKLYWFADSVLGTDFIAPEDIQARFGLKWGTTYSPEQLQELHHSFPSRERILWLKEHGYVLVAGPAMDLSLFDMRTLRPAYFSGHVHARDEWYVSSRHSFAFDQHVTTCWIMIRKEAVPNSGGKLYTEQLGLLEPVREHVPSTVYAVWVIIAYRGVRGVHLFSASYVYTSGLDNFNDRIIIGMNGNKGLEIVWGLEPFYGAGGEIIKLMSAIF